VSDEVTERTGGGVANENDDVGFSIVLTSCADDGVDRHDYSGTEVDYVVADEVGSRNTGPHTMQDHSRGPFRIRFRSSSSWGQTSCYCIEGSLQGRRAKCELVVRNRGCVHLITVIAVIIEYDIRIYSIPDKPCSLSKCGGI
jgi:hypothetical protein